MNAAQTGAAAPAGAVTIRRRSARLTAVTAGVALNLLLVVLSVAALVPIAWMISTSLKPAGTEYEWPIRWIPDRVMLENYVRAHTVMNFAVYYRNTIVIAALSTLGATLTSTLAAYAFARLRFV